MPATTSDRVRLNLGCGPHRAPAPWLNLDCVETDDIRPDIIVDHEWPLKGWADGSVHEIYLGHVLEHVPWDDLGRFLGEVRRVLAPDGRIAVVGPDVHRAIERFRQGGEPWSIVRACLEDGNPSPGLGPDPRPGGRHQWNCYEERVVKLLRAGGFSDVTPVPLPDGKAQLAGFPVVSFVGWQMAVIARR